MTDNKNLPYIFSATAGFVICLLITLLTGRKEAWDAPLYFVMGIPLMCAVAFFISYRNPERSWRWVLSMAVGQSLALLLSGNSLSLWPLSIIAMTICSVPQFISALVASRLAGRHQEES